MENAEVSGRGLWRSRWAAIGAAVAVALGAGGLFVASATSGVQSNFVSVTPVRIVDTRISVGVATSLVAAQPVVVQVTGSIPTTEGTATVVPTGAKAVVVNVTAVQPTAEGYLSVRPGDATGVPATSTLNFSPGQIIANSQTLPLPAAGNLQFYYGDTAGATVHFLVDVVGYYLADESSGGGGAAAEFFALMPPDNSSTVALGADVDFPQDGPNTDSAIISRTGPSAFNLASIGVYRVSVQVSVNEPGQLMLTLNGVDLAYTVAGRATGTSQITLTALVQTTVINSILTVQNPSDNSSALTITPLAGGTRAVSATLLIELVE